jgi:hypothetical protein
MNADTKNFVHTPSPTNPSRMESIHPISYRLGRRAGEMVLQGAFQWAEGGKGGVEWRDMPTVDLDES